MTFVVPSGADAQTPPAPAAPPSSDAQVAVRVTVVDSVTKKPVARAHVRLVSDARAYDGFTDANGVVSFAAVVAADYGVRVTADGYRFGAGGDVTPAGGALQAFTVIGTRTKLSRIGAVASRTPVQPNGAETVSAGDPSAAIAGSVGAAVPTITALSPGPDGSLLIHGHDASTTATTLNGAPVFPSTTKNQLGLLGNDIFSSAGLGAGAVPGAPNGSLDVSTYDPTIDWTGIVQERASSFGGTAFTLQERGTAGRVGLAFTHAGAELGKPLDGRFFADTSGLAYTHHANALSGGDAFTARYGFGANHVALLSAGSVMNDVPLSCEVLSGPLPCGFGPDNTTRHRASFVQLRDNLTLDRATVGLQLFTSRTEDAQLFANEVSGGANVGFTNDAVTSRVGYLVNLGLLYAGSRVANVRVSSYRDVTQAGGTFASSAFAPPVASSVSSLSLDVPVVASRSFTLSAAAGHDSSAGVARGTFDLRTTYRLTNRDQATASFATGHLGGPQQSFAGVGDPSNLTVDCASGALLGDGPLLPADTPSATTQLKASIGHTGARISFNVDAFRDTTRNAAVGAIMPAGALPASGFVPGFLTQAAQTAAARCGAPVPVSPSSLFFHVTAPVERAVNDGFDASAQVQVGAKIRLDGAYSLTRARAFGSGFPFSAGSNLIAGAQLPTVPLHRASAKLAYALSRSVSLLGVANVFGANNASTARPVSDVDVAARFATFAGDLTFAVQNVANADGGPFARFDPFPTLARPIAPRTYSVRYRFALGRQGIDRAALLSPPFSLQVGFAFVQHDFEPAPPGGDWLAPDKESPFCGPEQLAAAKGYQDAIRAYDASVRGALAANPRLTAFPDSSFGALEMSFVHDANGYAIRLHLLPGQARKIAPFTACTRVHNGSYDDAQKLHLYAPTWQENEQRGFALYYSSQAGVYFAPEAVDATSGSERELRLGAPPKAPADPFAVSEKTCPATYRGAVDDALKALKWYVTASYADGHPAAPEGFSITKHAAKSEPWLEIRAEDRTFGEAIVTCLDLPTISSKDLAARGLSGANFPSFDYAPSLGFYRASIEVRAKP